VRHQNHHHFPSLPRQSRRGKNGGHGFSRRDSKNFYADQKNRRDDESFPLARIFADAALRQTGSPTISPP
jgi:hypothetical protein